MTCVKYPDVLASDEAMPVYPTHDQSNHCLETEFGLSVFKVPLRWALRVMRLCGCVRARLFVFVLVFVFVCACALMRM
jgi:hypothetical protein